MLALRWDESCSSRKHRKIRKAKKSEEKPKKTKKKRLISIREIRAEQTSDGITVTAEGLGRSGGKRLPRKGSPGWLTAVPHAEDQRSCSPKFKIHRKNSNKIKPEAGYFATGLKGSFGTGASGSTGTLIMWKLPRKRTRSSKESFVSTTGVQDPQVGKPKYRYAACAGQEEVSIGRRATQQVLLEMQ